MKSLSEVQRFKLSQAYTYTTDVLRDLRKESGKKAVKRMKVLEIAVTHLEVLLISQ